MQNWSEKMGEFDAEILHKLPTVLTAEELLNKAFGRGSKVSGRSREKAINKLATVGNVISSHLNSVMKAHPSYTSMPEFYRELIDITVGLSRLRKSLAALKWAERMVQKVVTKGIRQIKGGKSPDTVIRETYGRVASIIRQIDDELRYLNEVKKVMRKIPVFLNIPVIVVAGYPNVGKSSLVSKLSSVKPEVASYPFTTKEIYVGIIQLKDRRAQIVDTPGMLDRPLSKRNEMERRAILCIKHIADCIVFVIDPSESCGYSVEKQFSLLKEVKELKKPVLEVYSKADMHDMRDRPAFSCKTGEGLEKLKEIIFDVIY
jgi:nucleolar GTP-binding protein